MLKRLEIAGFKSFARKTVLDFSSSVTAIVGPNGSGKSNVAEAFRFALGEQSMKSMRGKRSEDLIWSGSNTTARANRAAVAVVFDNRKRIFPKLDFDEVSIERAVFRDGQSEYSLNGSKVRLRDVQEQLASANIGETGHHIISQGEADRILLAHPRERRAMLEDALGLKSFEFKKQEAQKKLEKTQENVKQVEALRRELVPHLKFLGKQVEKLERAEELIRDLIASAQEYLAIEELYIKTEKESSVRRLAEATERLATATAQLAPLQDRAQGDAEGMKRAQAVRDAERELDRVSIEHATLSREIGRVEGALDAAKKRKQELSQEPYVKIPRADLSELKSEVERTSAEGDVTGLRAALASLKSVFAAFFDRFASEKNPQLSDEEEAVAGFEKERESLARTESSLREAVDTARSALNKAREVSIAYEETGRESQYRVLEIAEAKAHEEINVVREEARGRELQSLAEEFERDRAEVLALAGSAALSYKPLISLPVEERKAQEDRKKAMERLKIRVEEAGGTGEDVRKEFEETRDREAFLARELEDLEKSMGDLKQLITDLDEELTKTFTEGLTKVNASFGEFFAIMFGGGSARLILEEPEEAEHEDEETEEMNEKAGIEIAVTLPKKRVQSLMQLSGGERALTSIALIFAMSQVNPPPFLILDETDAALDEANSRRYGDMIENLAKKSQLVVITHNRETMSRAGVLYGVTMGGDGVSKLLSVKFEEAVAVAK